MQKRDKKLSFSKETVRDLTSSRELAPLAKVLGGVEEDLEGTCIPGGTTHIRTAMC